MRVTPFEGQTAHIAWIRGLFAYYSACVNHTRLEELVNKIWANALGRPLPTYLVPSAIDRERDASGMRLMSSIPGCRSEFAEFSEPRFLIFFGQIGSSRIIVWVKSPKVAEFPEVARARINRTGGAKHLCALVAVRHAGNPDGPEMR